MKYEVQVSEYGTVARRTDIEVEAKSFEEAEKKAIEIASSDPDIEWETQECVSGWEYQVENIQEIGV